MKTKLAVIVSHPIQYQVPVWRELARRDELDVEVFYASLAGAEKIYNKEFNREITWDIPLLDDYHWRLLENKPMTWLNWRFAYNCPETASLLAGNSFDAVLLVGKEYSYYLQALRAARLNKLKILYRAETPPPIHNPIFRLMAEWHRKIIYSRINILLCVGHSQKQYYREYGIPEQKMYWSPYCVDNDWFGDKFNKYLPERDMIRKKFGFAPEAKVLGFAGKFIQKKRPMDLIQAVEQLQKNDKPDYSLLMVGDGPLLGQCKEYVKARNVKNVVFTGFLNQSEIPKAYIAMDCFVLPSDARETWGLVVNEAMNSRLPLISSDTAGCASDLVFNGENGFTYSQGDINSLVLRIREISADKFRMNKMGIASAEIIRKYSVQEACYGITESLRTCLE